MDYRFTVVEESGKCLALYVFKNDRCVYCRGSYGVVVKPLQFSGGPLWGDIWAILYGNANVRRWNDNCEGFGVHVSQMIGGVEPSQTVWELQQKILEECPDEYTIVATEDGLYLRRMGAAALSQFGVSGVERWEFPEGDAVTPWDEIQILQAISCFRNGERRFP